MVLLESMEWFIVALPTVFFNRKSGSQNQTKVNSNLRRSEECRQEVAQQPGLLGS